MSAPSDGFMDSFLAFIGTPQGILASEEMLASSAIEARACRCGFTHTSGSAIYPQIKGWRSVGCFHFVPADIEPTRSALPEPRTVRGLTTRATR